MREGITFDDVLLEPKFSNIVSRKDVNTKTKLTRNITINIPIISANMDTVTEAPMAIAMAELGGIGIIHRFLTIEQQVKEVKKVKRAHNFIIEQPYTILEEQTVYDLKNEMSNKGVTSLLVVNQYNKIAGIVTTRDLLFEDDENIKIKDIMTPFEKFSI
ncbi:MAG: hypothetical protein KatS3mg068_0277 [Candidatus Sericytochromatia bacterium]|nr:MAG: hypothetical protein KatS3mg068_0277 [Candidatus Sericytochromatia bacterium]